MGWMGYINFDASSSNLLPCVKKAALSVPSTLDQEVEESFFAHESTLMNHISRALEDNALLGMTIMKDNDSVPPGFGLLELLQMLRH